MKKKLLNRLQKSRENKKGFTMVELIVVIAILGILAVVLVPQFTVFGDKAMGTTALSDMKNAMSLVIAHNMDSTTSAQQDDLVKMLGLDTNNKDSSGSKTITIDTTGTVITYVYARGGVTLTGTGDTKNQSMTWTVSGIASGTNRFDALKEGLKFQGLTAA